MNDRSLDGQVAIVTGGGAGIGAACVERLAAEGARVALVDRAETAAAAATGDQILFVHADATKEDEVASSVARVLHAWGRIDVLVNAAGGFTEAPPLSDLDGEQWDRLITLNLTSAYLCCRHAAPVMRAAGYGRIVNITSMAGRTALSGVSHAYHAAKAGLTGFTRSLGLELAPHGVTVNAVAPGVVLSPRVAHLYQNQLDAILAVTPLGRTARPEEIADAVWYLASPGAGYITGTTLDVNGGRFFS